MRRHRDQDGYVLFGIAIGLIIMGIFMGAAVPLWQKVMQREREKELIFRGYQYMQAIELYQKKFPGAYPPNLDVLVEQKFLRRLYEDPMTEDGEWRILRQLSPELQPGAQQQQAAERAGINDLNRSRARMRTPGGAPAGARQQQQQGSESQFQSSLGRTSMGRQGADTGLGGIVGVASKSEEETFYKVPGKDKYKDWLFVWGAQTQAQPVAAGDARSPFPGLPPPPGLTSLRFGMASAAPGQPAPGQAQPGTPPGRPGASPGGGPGLQPGNREPQPGLGRPRGNQRPEERRRQPPPNP